MVMLSVCSQVKSGCSRVSYSVRLCETGYICDESFGTVSVNKIIPLFLDMKALSFVRRILTKVYMQVQTEICSFFARDSER